MVSFLVTKTATPAGLVGFGFAGFIGSQPFFTSAVTVVFTLVIVGVVMIIVEKLPRASAVKDGEALSWRRALVIGFVQVLSLIPGVSRSGSTILAGRFAGLKPAAAAEYSFLVSIPIMLGVMAGSWIGGWGIAAGLGLQGALWVGAGLGVLALFSLLPELRTRASQSTFAR